VVAAAPDNEILIPEQDLVALAAAATAEYEVAQWLKPDYLIQAAAAEVVMVLTEQVITAEQVVQELL
jgi:hypothetical protein